MYAFPPQILAQICLYNKLQTVCVSKKAREESGVCYLGSLYTLAQKMKHTQDAVNCPEEADIAFYSNSVLSTT